MRLVDLEIARQPWDDIPCGCSQSARHLADLLRRAAQSAEIELKGATECHVWSPVVLYSPAPAVAEVALAALADDLSQQAHEQFLELLNSLVHGEGTDLPEACERLASRGIWLLYRELALDRSINATATAFELLATLEPDRDRLRRAQIALGESLPWDYRPGMLNDPLDSSATDE